MPLCHCVTTACARTPAYLDGHDDAAGHVLHLVHYPIRSSPELGDLLQVIGLHHEVLDEGGEGGACHRFTPLSHKHDTDTLHGHADLT